MVTLWLEWFALELLSFPCPNHSKIIPKAIAMTILGSFLVLTPAIVLTVALMTLPASAANNNKQDTSQLSQYLAYRLFRKAGIHAPRSNFARVTVMT